MEFSPSLRPHRIFKPVQSGLSRGDKLDHLDEPVKARLDAMGRDAPHSEDRTMTPSVPPDLMYKVWNFPLFEALYGRRSRRFGLGFEMTEGPFRHKSPRAAVPLDETEEALLVAAGVGFSGIALWDQSRPLSYRAGDGRTFPSTSRGRRTALFYTNDHGVYVIDPTGGSASKLRGIDTPDERQKILALYQKPRKGL